MPNHPPPSLGQWQPTTSGVKRHQDSPQKADQCEKFVFHRSYSSFVPRSWVTAVLVPFSVAGHGIVTLLFNVGTPCLAANQACLHDVARVSLLHYSRSYPSTLLCKHSVSSYHVVIGLHWHCYVDAASALLLKFSSPFTKECCLNAEATSCKGSCHPLSRFQFECPRRGKFKNVRVGGKNSSFSLCLALPRNVVIAPRYMGVVKMARKAVALRPKSGCTRFPVVCWKANWIKRWMPRRSLQASSHTQKKFALLPRCFWKQKFL